MASEEVIVIEDTPPSSPVKPTKQKPKLKATQKKKMYYQPQNPEFPVAEQAMIWSRNTTNFIKQSMNSVQQNNRMSFGNVQKKPAQMGVPSRPVLPRNGFNGMLPTAPYTMYNYDPFMAPMYPVPMSLGNSTFLDNLCNNNFWLKVKLEERSDQGEIVTQYYLDNNVTPVELDIEKENAIPEFIDINTFSQNMDIEPIFCDKQTNDSLATMSTEIEDKKRNKNYVPLFLKRNRPLQNNAKMKIPETDSSNINQEDNEDVIFIGEFKYNEKLPPVSQVEVKEENDKNSNESITTETSSSDQSFKEESKKTTPAKKYSYKFGKRKRKNRTALPPRRNPKRQVQIEKEFLKMIDDVLMESEKEEKIKKTSGSSQKKPAGKTSNKHYRRSPRGQATSGATYNPPSPLTTALIRDWPSEGMHERPEYDPASGQVQPFDHFIRNISNKYNATNVDTNKNFAVNDIITTENLEKKSFPELCHEMLHHVLAYVATVKMLEKEENQSFEDKADKLQFLEKLQLEKNNDKIENKICDILHKIIDDVTSKDVKQNETMSESLNDLLKNTILFYCLTNNVDKVDVANYIASINPEDIIKLSNEQFKLLSISET